MRIEYINIINRLDKINKNFNDLILNSSDKEININGKNTKSL
jgi:hypothetical protein